MRNYSLVLSLVGLGVGLVLRATEINLNARTHVRMVAGMSKKVRRKTKKEPTASSSNSPHAEYRVMAKQIAELSKWNISRLEKEALRRDALIFETDKTPIDIVLRRTVALLKHLRTMPKGPSLKGEAAALKSLIAQNRPGLSDGAKAELFGKVTALRRKIAFQNPLLNFDKILFLKHNRKARGDNHMVDQYLGFNQDGHGGIFVLENPFSDKPVAKSLLANSTVQNGRLKGRNIDNKGSFISLELDYDAKTLYFAFTEAKHDKPKNVDPSKMTPLQRLRNGHVLDKLRNGHYYWTKERTQHIFKVKSDGTGLTQLTDTRWNDFDPCVLPNGRIVFVSDRIGGNQRCGNRFCSTYTLHAMMPDGSDVITFSYHDTNEWHPSIDNNGMIVYTRWDYVDRDSDIAHHIWHCFPDGRDPRSYHGNYPKIRESRPWMEMAIRAIPNSRKYVAVSTPHHGQNYGSMVMIDISKPDDGSTSQLKRITPEILFPEAESAPGVPQRTHGGKNRYFGEVYGQPWPLDEDFYLCVYNNGEYPKHALYLVDSFGNRIHLYHDDSIGCLDPMPFKPRKRPPVIPTRTLQAKADRTGNEDLSTGTISVMNIYESQYEFPKGTKIKELRIVNIFPKPNLYINKPNIGLAAQSLARGVLGTVPVEEDGSCYFKCPTGCPIYFQALDEKGMMVQNMRSDTFLHPGESMSCIGCHESKHSTPKNVGGKAPIALRRPPSDIKPEAPGGYPLTFPRLVQPVLDKHCVACHNKEKKAPSLRGDRLTKGRSEAFVTLARFAWGMAGGNGGLRRNKRSYSLPGKDGARISKLYKHLASGHKSVKLSPQEMRRITMWIDCNSNFFGAYIEPEKQAKGEVVKPLLGLPRHTAFEKLKY